MNRFILSLLCLIAIKLSAQNVGINQPSPTHSLHISPINNGDNPIRIDGLQSYSIGDTSLLIINNSTGVVKYITSSDFVNLISNNSGLGTDDQQLDSLILNNYILTAYLEDGGNASVDLTAIRDSAINYLINNSDTLFSTSFTDSIISTLYNNADTLLYNSNFINNLRDSIDTDVDSIRLDGTILHVYENGNDLTADLSSLSDNDNDPTNEHNTNASLSGNILSITDAGGSITVDLTPLINTAVANAIPAGSVTAFAGSSAPSGYLVCDGSAVNRSTYPDLFSAIGTMYGAGDGSTTFNLPNYSGQFLRGVDNGAGIDPDAATRTDRGDGTTGDAVGTIQSNEILAHSHTVNPPSTNTSTDGAHTHTVDPPVTNTSTDGAHFHTVNPPATNTNSTGAHTHSIDPPATTTSTNGNHSHSTVTQLGNNTNGGPDNWGVQHSDPGGGNWGTYTGSTSAAGNHAHTVNIPVFNSAASGNHSHSVDISQFNSGNSGNHSHTVNIAQFNSGNNGNHTHSVDIAQFNSGNVGGAETRPTNVSVLWCIKF